MRVTLYAVTTYYVPTIADAQSRGMVTTDEDEARGIASAHYNDDAVIRTVTVTIPDDAWKVSQ